MSKEASPRRAGNHQQSWHETKNDLREQHQRGCPHGNVHNPHESVSNLSKTVAEEATRRNNTEVVLRGSLKIMGNSCFLLGCSGEFSKFSYNEMGIS